VILIYPILKSVHFPFRLHDQQIVAFLAQNVLIQIYHVDNDHNVVVVMDVYQLDVVGIVVFVLIVPVMIQKLRHQLWWN